jgi:Bacterial protein of unknown function (HtrL_YibB)
MAYKTTAVTMFFDLTQLKDRTEAIRPASFYMEHGKVTLSLPGPMVIFCDASTKPQMEAIRSGAVPDPALTVYVVKNITDYDFYKDNIDIVLENRKGQAHYINNRNTASYCLLTVFKFHALRMAQQLIQTPFYAWADFGGSHIMRSFHESMTRILADPRPKITLCYVHYRGTGELASMKDYFREGGPCGVVAGCFTVEAAYMNRFFNGTQALFHEMLAQGVGHSEEGVLTYFYHRYPQLCTLYYGDYYSIGTNYHEPREDHEAIRWFFIQKCLEKGRPDLAKEAVIAILPFVRPDQRAELEAVLRR